nr:DUF6691 family protein [Rhizobium sp. SG_E_25_P2]
MMRELFALAFGAIFGLGIAISGMINPAKVMNFFDVMGSWDPSLAFVMIGALAVAIPGYALVFRMRRAPVLNAQFAQPTKTALDRRLIGGAALFGLGWGAAGFCPGGAIPAIGLGEASVYVFLLAMIAGMVVMRLMLARRD